jgi:hypothetical protein
MGCRADDDDDNCYYWAHIEIFKSRKTRLMQPVACIAENGTAHKFGRKFERKRPLAEPGP